MGRASASAFGWAFALTVCATACHERVPSRRVDAGVRPPREIEIVARTPHIATFPCAEPCHDARPSDPTPRELSLFHAGRRLEHGPALRWCDRCHALDALDRLVLLDARTVSFDASDEVCAQCHGEQHRDWSEGIHGSVTGSWSGPARRQLCTGCHDPHTPGPIHLEALPPPRLDPRIGGGHP